MGFDKTVGEQLLKKLQGTGAVLTPSTFADVWIEAERKMLDKINKSQANLDRINVLKILKGTNDRERAKLQQHCQPTSATTKDVDFQSD